jgi:hypothetical protein
VYNRLASAIRNNLLPGMSGKFFGFAVAFQYKWQSIGHHNQTAFHCRLDRRHHNFGFTHNSNNNFFVNIFFEFQILCNFFLNLVVAFAVVVSVSSCDLFMHPILYQLVGYTELFLAGGHCFYHNGRVETS